MKVINCELCGSNQFIKQDGIYVCQHCGTKYSAEEAKKMMVEGTVEVTGSVRIDNSANLEKALKNARRARNDNNSELAEKYYGEIRDIDPDNWEAVFFNTYFKSMQCKIAEIQSAAISVNNCIDSVLNLIKENVNGETEQEEAIKEVTTSVISISNMLLNAAKNHFNSIDSQIQNDYTQEYIANAAASINTVYYLGDALDVFFKGKNYSRELTVTAWKSAIELHQALLDSRLVGLYLDKDNEKNVIMKYVDKIKEHDSSYQAPDVTIKSNIGYIILVILGVLGFLFWLFSDFLLD